MAQLYATAGETGESAHSPLLPHLLGRRGPSGYGSATTAAQVAAGYDGRGRTILITGCNTGLGKEAARVLAARGATVIMAVRSTERGQQAAADITASISASGGGAPPRLEVLPLDLGSLRSVRGFVAAWGERPLDCVIANAGVMACPFELTVDGHETQWATNHLGHFALCTGMLPALRKGAAASGEHSRVVVLSSAAHFSPYKKEAGGPIRWDALDGKEGYNEWAAYGQSKLMNVLFARELNKRAQAAGDPVTAVACHPGVILTELGRHAQKVIPLPVRLLVRLLLGPFFKSVAQGAATEVWLAVSKSELIQGGEYYADVNPSSSTAASHDAAAGARLWELSERLVREAGSKA